MVNWKYFLKNGALTAIHDHISHGMDLDTYHIMEWIWTLAGEIFNINFVSEIAPNMLTKHKKQ